MKKRIASILLVLALVICVFPVSAFADYNPYADEDYYKDNVPVNAWGGTGARYKTSTSKVYVRPTSAPCNITLVQTVCYVNSNETFKNVNGAVSLSSGAKYGITNRVYEDGDISYYDGKDCVLMWLGVRPYSQAGTVKGVWSPDWTGSGNVIIV